MSTINEMVEASIKKLNKLWLDDIVEELRFKNEQREKWKKWRNTPKTNIDQDALIGRMRKAAEEMEWEPPLPEPTYLSKG